MIYCGLYMGICLHKYIYIYTELQYPKIAKVFRLLIQLEHPNLNKKQFSSFMVLAYWIIGNLFLAPAELESPRQTG